MNTGPTREGQAARKTWFRTRQQDTLGHCHKTRQGGIPRHTGGTPTPRRPGSSHIDARNGLFSGDHMGGYLKHHWEPQGAFVLVPGLCMYIYTHFFVVKSKCITLIYFWLDPNLLEPAPLRSGRKRWGLFCDHQGGFLHLPLEWLKPPCSWGSHLPVEGPRAGSWEHSRPSCSPLGQPFAWLHPFPSPTGP